MCIQKPYEKGDRQNYAKDVINRSNNGELTNEDSIHFPDSLKYTTTGGRTVYGGGGIMPDVYVPLDTTKYTKLHRELAAKSCITSTTLKWIDKNRSQLIKRYNSNWQTRHISQKTCAKDSSPTKQSSPSQTTSLTYSCRKQRKLR